MFGNVFGWDLDTNLDLDLGLQSGMFDGADFGPISSTENLSAAWLLASSRPASPKEEGLNSEKARDPFGREHDTPWVGTIPFLRELS